MTPDELIDEAKDARADMDPSGGLAVIAPDTPVAPAHGIAAIALNMAMKYHDMNMIKDGALYQQYKLEGRNIRALHLDEVFETAIRIELHLLGSSDRIAKVLIDAISVRVEDEPETSEVADDTTGPVST